MSTKVLPTRGSMETANLPDLLIAAEPLVADGWSVEGALNHLQGMCNAATCCGQFAGSEDEPMLVCRGCGEAFDEINTAFTHYAVGTSSDSGVCADSGYDLMPRSEAM